MKNVKLELHVDRRKNEILIFREMPAYGDVGQLASGALQTLVLNDGQHRVKVGVFNATLPLERIKQLARLAIDASAKSWAI